MAFLTRTLEQMAPGQYRTQELQATSETLEQVAKDQTGKQDVSPLFHLLEVYAEPAALEDLARRYPQWNYYSTIALAKLPEGQGIPALVNLEQDPAFGRAGKDTLVLQMLAQASAQYPNAASVLVEQARANTIPSQAWKQIADGLAGDQYQFGSPVLDKDVPAEVESSLAFYQVHSNQNFYVHTPVGSIPGLRTYHVEDSNQNFFSVPVSSAATNDEISRRIQTIEQLLDANPTSPGAQALADARLSLQRRLTP